MKPKDIQRALANAGFYNGAIDGHTGPLTRHALVLFQTDQGLDADGVLDHDTEAKLQTFLPQAEGG